MLGQGRAWKPSNDRRKLWRSYDNNSSTMKHSEAEIIKLCIAYNNYCNVKKFKELKFPGTMDSRIKPKFRTENAERYRALHLSEQVFAISHSIWLRMDTEWSANWLKWEKIVNKTCFCARKDLSGKRGQLFRHPIENGFFSSRPTKKLCSVYMLAILYSPIVLASEPPLLLSRLFGRREC